MSFHENLWSTPPTTTPLLFLLRLSTDLFWLCSCYPCFLLLFFAKHNFMISLKKTLFSGL